MSFSFGAPAASKPPAYSFGTPASTAPTTSLFGAPAASTPAPSGGLFGSAPPASGSLFGQTSAPAPSGGLFGATSAAPSGGLFGASQPAAGGSLFGAPASQPAQSGGLFGATPAAGVSLFGQPAASQPAQTGGLFGQSTGGSLFGAGATSQAGGSLFGQPPQQQQQQAPQPAVTAAPLFGQSQSAASTSLFGSKPASTSLFGSTSLQPTSQPQAQPQQPLPKLGDPLPPNPNEPSITSRLEAIKSAWDPQDPKCRFQTYFYNEPTPPNTAAMYGRPPQGSDEKAWLKAVRENPDPERLVPAIAVGFPSLQSRIDSQTRQSLSHQALLTEIHTHLGTLSSTHTLTTSLRTLRASQTATALASRLLALVAKLSALSTARNASVRKEEDQLRVQLEAMVGEVEGVKSRGNELWSGVGALKARKSAMEEKEWAVVDEEGLKQVLEILASQQAGLDHLTKTLNGAEADVEVMKEAFGMAKPGKSVSRRD